MPISLLNKSIIGITTGELSGIGPEVTRKALERPELKRLSGAFLLIDKGSAIDKIDRAVQLIKDGSIKALVTAPVSKEIIARTRPNFIGHTEYLAAKFKVSKVATMFVGRRLKVVTLTRHIPLASVAASLDKNEILDTIELSHSALIKYFKIEKPKIALCGLNPHCGEGGRIGNEEIRIISPAVLRAAKKGIKVYGPVSADAVFYQALAGEFDLVISMYHDQGLAPFKMLEFNRGVNLTLGLPFIRTSPDHGAASGIKGRNIADPASMVEAIKLALRLKDAPCL